MSATVPCTPCCATPQTVDVPGRTGDPGSNGTNGLNAFSITAAPLITPAVAATVTVSVSSTSWMVVGEYVIIGQGVGTVLVNPGPAHFKVTTINSLSSVTLTFLHYSGDVGVGITIDSGATVTPAGVQSAFPTTTKGDLIADDGATAPNPDPQRFPVGNNGRSIFADSTQALGVKYAGGTQTLNVNTTAVGTGADVTLDTLMTFTVPANTLLNLGDSLEFEGMFDIAANGDTKLVEFYFGATQVIHFGAAAQNGGTMMLRGRIIRTGAATQRVYGEAIVTSGAGAGSVFSQDGTAAEALGGGVVLKATGTNGAANANDIIQRAMVIKYCAA